MAFQKKNKIFLFLFMCFCIRYLSFFVENREIELYGFCVIQGGQDEF